MSSELEKQIWIIIGATKRMKKLTTNEFVARAKEIHGNTYDYSDVVYRSTHDKVEIVCPLHGLFLQSPHGHIGNQKQGCPKCYGRDKSTIEFISEATKLHGIKYNYSSTQYKRCNRDVDIECPLHGTFRQLPLNHLKGKGCPKCAHVISRAETEFLDYYGISTRNYRIPQWKTKPVDGISGNVVYEFLGDYWHGNLEVYNGEKRHPKRKITYQKLNEKTYLILGKLKSLGYEVKYIWESDWNKFKRGEHLFPRLLSV
jgi:hypothetical protein